MEIPNQSKICIICHQVVSQGKAARVKDDAVIQGIRGLKRLLRIAQNNELYVCEKDLPVHAEKRKKFEKELLIIGGVAIAVLFLLIGLPLLSGRFDISLFVSSIFISFLIVLFGILFKYAPAVGAVADITPVIKRVESTIALVPSGSNRPKVQKGKRKKLSSK